MTPLQTTQLTDRELIESVVRNFYIVDYGYIHAINADGTIDVKHAKRQQLMDGTELPDSITKKMEVLTIGCQDFSLKFTLHTGDQVLLLGLKDYVPKCAEVNKATSQDVFIHYARNTMKALPLSIFNSDAKVKVQIDGGNLGVTADKIKLNGDSKSFVTYSELNNALQTLWGKIKTHTHVVSLTTAASGTAAASVVLAEASLDISASKTTTVVTGG